MRDLYSVQMSNLAVQPPTTAMVDRRVLLVEDDETVAEVATSYLRAAGLLVTVARDGFSALRALEQSSPDLIVLDRMLPGIDGVEVCRRIRRSSGTPIIMLTALGS
jgi:DNA-binding response OmpR family regulator